MAENELTMRYTIILFSILMGLASCNSRSSFTIEGNISDATGSQLYLNRRDKSKLIVVDSTRLQEGGFFHLEGNIEIPECFYITVQGKRGYKMFFAENGTIKVYGSADSLYNLDVQGSITNAQYEIYNAGLEELYDLSSDLYDQQHLAFFQGDSSRGRDIEVERKELEKKIRIYQADFIRNHTASYASPEQV
ncbi:MAG: DUF4369 domain-containing protein [Bacteroidales bacterium]